MSNFDVSIILRMVDQLTAPARRAMQAVRAMQQSVQQTASAVRAGSRAMERPFIDALSRMQRKAVEFSVRVRKAFADIAQGPGARLNEMGGKLNAQRWQMMTTMFYAAPLALPFKMAAQNELGLARLGQTAGWRTSDLLGRLGKKDEFTLLMEDRNARIREIARDSRQSATDLLSVYTDMVAQGMAEPEALKGLKTLGKVMTATGMAAEDASALGFALREQFGLAPDRWMDVMGQLHKAGKMGGFELKDMAKWFPQMGAMTSMMGMSGAEFAGRLAAGLQVVRKGASDPDQAGNNMVNLLQKMFQIETRKQFKKAMGIDLADELKKTVEAGGDPILRTVELARQYMDKTGNPFLTGNLFADRQALLAMLPLLGKGLRRWKEINAEVMSANREEILRDHATTVKTMWGAWRQLANAVEWFSDTMVKAVLGDAGQVLKQFAERFDQLNAFARENKPLMRNMVLGFGGLMLAALGIRTLLFLFNSFKYAALGVWTALRLLAAPLKQLNRIAGPGGLLGGLARIGTGFNALGARFLLAGAATVQLIGKLARLRGLLLMMGGFLLRRIIFGWPGLIVSVLAAIVPDDWWDAAVVKLREGFNALKEVVSSFVSDAIGLLQSLWDKITGIPEALRKALTGNPVRGDVPGTMEGFIPQSMPEGMTIPGVANTMLQGAQVQNDNRQTTNNVTVNVPIHAVVTNTTPQGIAGAVAGAGQSVASEVKKALSDGGQ